MEEVEEAVEEAEVAVETRALQVGADAQAGDGNGADGVVLAERMPDPVLRHEDPVISG